MALPTTLRELAESLFEKLPKTLRLDFVTDSYFTQSIKSIERTRRGTAKTHLIKGSSITVPRDWKGFLSNEENKMNFTRFLLDEWKKDKYASKLCDKQILFTCVEKCVRLTSVDGQKSLSEEVHELCSTQEEADTKIILHCLHVAANSADAATITVRSSDTDGFVLLLKFSQSIKQRILFDTGAGNKRRLVDLKNVILENGNDICAVLPAVHAYTGCDTTIAFVKKGKLTAPRLLKQHPEFLDSFTLLGRATDIPDSLFSTLEHFTYVFSMEINQ